MRTTSPQSNQHLAGAGRLQRIQVDMSSTAEENVGRQTGGGGRRTGAINLTVICIKVQRQTMIGDDSCQISCVDDEEDRSEDRILWNATDDIRNAGTAASTANVFLRPAGYDKNHVTTTSSTSKVTLSLLRRIS